jgi:16S rRNA (guanine(527)-N(7))-methyltransferase RsmG
LKSSENRAEPADRGIQVCRALDIYRSDLALQPFLSERFVQRMRVFGGILALWGGKTNLTAHPGDPVETALHAIDSLMPLAIANSWGLDDIVAAFAAKSRVLDFGSGAGFPGLILASACEARFTLAEARHKRASFLKVAAAEMGLHNVDVLAGRLIGGSDISGTFDAILSRASGPSPAFYEIAARALTPGGVAILYSTPSQRLDITGARNAGLGSYRRLNYTVRRADETVERVLVVWRKQEKGR